ncbi:MAG: DUF3822 family protein [Eudoraea sp.]|nr:DUF3822 family protein [Eudoraea sp.]NNK29795.1 DUF3822 family protein [Flavobacteriaceae bacterium]MBT8206219.1 DUF3822 family protein [Eudoraea sp.]MBT8209853.1 DUF3822 family protein [Eudoraea sp.]MBT8222542.1 DUF3822 family protein [Eudoraea sp.]
MTKKKINKGPEDSVKDYYKLSIQVSLNGLSFCILDTIGNSITLSKRIDFGKELSPYEVLKELKTLIRKEGILNYTFTDVVVIHRNTLFSLVPKALFDADELANYLKFNVKMLANDLAVYDEVSNYDLVNVYVPFVNLNNYIYELFGEFEFKHHGTVLLDSLLNLHNKGKAPICYVHVDGDQIDITVLEHKELLFYNSFYISSKEDFIYYLLFTLEQLKLDPETVKVRLFGTIEEEDDLYEIAYEYIQNIGIFMPTSDYPEQTEEDQKRVDFTVINAL